MRATAQNEGLPFDDIVSGFFVTWLWLVGVEHLRGEGSPLQWQNKEKGGCQLG